MQKQIFGSALNRPWALVKWGGNQPNGRRPSTAVAYLTDPVKDAGGTIVGYEGGLVEYVHTKVPDPSSVLGKRGWRWGPQQWEFRYSRPRGFAASDVCEFFPNGKSRDQGPAQSQIRAAKKRVPVNEVQS